MSITLQEELRQSKPFPSPEAEAAVSLARTAACLDHATAEMLRPYGITATQYNVLRILRGAGPQGLCRNEVRDRMVAPVPDATRLLDRLVFLGLVTRDRDTPDRRYVTARLTEAGATLLAELDPVVAAGNQRLLGHLGAERLRALIDLLAEVRARP